MTGMSRMTGMNWMARMTGMTVMNRITVVTRTTDAVDEVGHNYANMERFC